MEAGGAAEPVRMEAPEAAPVAVGEAPAVEENAQAQEEAVPQEEVQPEVEAVAPPEMDANLATILGKPKMTTEASARLGALLGGRSILTADAAEAEGDEAELEDLSGLAGVYDEAKVLEAWTALVEHVRGQNKQGLAATLSHGTLAFEDPTLKLTVANQIQFDELKECATQLLHFVRRHVGNGGLAFEVEVGEVEVKVAFLTPKDRYLQWAAEKPALEALRSRLDLDLP